MAEKHRSPIPFFLAFVLCLLLADASELRSESGNIARGKQTFESICSACHTIGGGIKVGPDLKDITVQRPAPWLAGFIADPPKVIKSGDPVATSLLKKFHGIEMPALGLSGDKIDDILAYLRSTSSPPKAQAQPATPAVVASARKPASKAQPPAPIPPPQPSQASAAPGPAPPAGSAEAGERLFLGSVSLQKGGPPCFSCHDVSTLPFPGGGTLGPDLTAAFAKFGATGMNSVLATLSFPTMRPIFDARPLTIQEQQDLEAFLQKTGPRSLIGRTVQIVLSALGGLLILVIAAWIIGENRISSVRKALVRKAGKPGGSER
jgi:mono/diheme cytochrome c family protein